MSKDAIKQTLVERFGLTISREANRGTILGTETAVFSVDAMYPRVTEKGKTLAVIIKGEVPYIDEAGRVGTKNQLSSSGSLNDVAASCGAHADDVLPFEVSDFITAQLSVREIEVSVTQTLEERDGLKRMITMFTITGENAIPFGKQLSRIRRERLSEASEHADLYSRMSAQRKSFTL